jgi:cytoskeleton protein RodZ
LTVKYGHPYHIEQTPYSGALGRSYMGAFGDNLRREREMRGVTLAEISESTKISMRRLKALEEEDFSALPGGVFNRGYVRAYAHFLGINEEETVADYVAASQEQPLPEDKFPIEIHEKPRKPALNPRRSNWPVALAVLALAVAGGSAYWFKIHKSQESAAANANGSSGIPAQAQIATESLAGPALRGNQKQATGKKISRETNPKEEEDSTEALQISARPASPMTDQEPGGAFSVVIRARESSWISIAADGQPLWTGTMSANSERSVTAGKELILKTGNAAGIEVSYNGRALGTLGKDKQVRTLTFNTAGLLQQ